MKKALLLLLIGASVACTKSKNESSVNLDYRNYTGIYFHKTTWPRNQDSLILSKDTLYISLNGRLNKYAYQQLSNDSVYFIPLPAGTVDTPSYFDRNKKYVFKMKTADTFCVLDFNPGFTPPETDTIKYYR